MVIYIFQIGTGNVNLEKFLFSSFLLILIFFNAILISIYFSKINDFRILFLCFKIIFIFFLLCSTFGMLKINPFGIRTGKTMLVFLEPSHFAIVVAPFFIL